MSLPLLDPAALVGKLNVLYVEDDEETARLLTNFLEKRVKQVHVTTNGEYGLELFRNKKVDLVITDIKMPYMDGLEMVRHLRKKNHSLKVIFTSAYHEEDLFLKAIELGAEGFLTKPISPNSSLLPLLKKVAVELEKKRLLKEYTDTLRLILDYIDSMVIVTDGDRLFNCNAAFLRFFQMGDIKLFRQEYPHLYTIFECREDYVCKEQWLEDVLHTPSPKVKIKHRIFLCNAKEINVQAKQKKYVVNFTDITRLEHEKSVLKEHATKDSVTKVLNRSSFQQLYEKELSFIEKTKGSFCVIFFNLQHLHRINDAYGHESTDALLYELAQLVEKFLKDKGSVARWGGGEFVILLPHSAKQVAEEFVQKLQNKINGHTFAIGEKIRCNFAIQQVSEHITLQHVFEHLTHKT